MKVPFGSKRSTTLLFWSATYTSPAEVTATPVGRNPPLLSTFGSPPDWGVPLAGTSASVIGAWEVRTPAGLNWSTAPAPACATYMSPAVGWAELSTATPYGLTIGKGPFAGGASISLG